MLVATLLVGFLRLSAGLLARPVPVRPPRGRRSTLLRASEPPSEPMPSLGDVMRHADSLLSANREDDSHLRQGVPLPTGGAGGGLRGGKSGAAASTSVCQVAVVFARPLVRDQVTAEYASRIRALVRELKDRRLAPNIIAFVGGGDLGTGGDGGGHVGQAAAGYLLFRQICGHQGVSLTGVEFAVEDGASAADAMSRAADAARRRRQAMQAAVDWAKLAAASPRKGRGKAAASNATDTDEPPAADVVGCHATLFSCEHDLACVLETHRHSPSVSLLGPWAAIEATWSFEYAAYPYLFAADDLTVFLAKTHTTMHALHALEANLRGVVDSLQFFQLGNYLTLIDTRKRLDKQLAVLHSPHRPFRITAADADAAADDDAAGGHRRALPLDESLESVVASLVDLTTVLKPAARRTEPVSRERFTEALMVVQDVLQAAARDFDPDRPLGWRALSLIVEDVGASVDGTGEENAFIRAATEFEQANNATAGKPAEGDPRAASAAALGAGKRRLPDANSLPEVPYNTLLWGQGDEPP